MARRISPEQRPPSADITKIDLSGSIGAEVARIIDGDTICIEQDGQEQTI